MQCICVTKISSLTLKIFRGSFQVEKLVELQGSSSRMQIKLSLYHFDGLKFVHKH